MEFVVRLPTLERYASDERWLIHEDGETRVAWIIDDPDRDRELLASMMQKTAVWLGFAHPRVSRVIRVELLDTRAVFIVDDDRGPTLVAATAQLPADERERWAVAQIIALADGLTAMRAHQAAFVHGRLESHRLFVDPSGHARLRAPVDPRRNYMGAGRITGLSSYLAPEQVKGLPCTPATDVYALATNLVHALTGRPPYADDDVMQSLDRIMTGPAPDVPDASPGVAAILARAFVKDPAGRYADPQAFAAALRGAVVDADEVDAVISDRIAAWWPIAEPAGGSHDLLGGRCHKRWSELTPTETPGVAHCGDCQQLVVEVTSLAEILPLLGRRCVSLRRS